MDIETLVKDAWIKRQNKLEQERPTLIKNFEKNFIDCFGEDIFQALLDEGDINVSDPEDVYFEVNINRIPIQIRFNGDIFTCREMENRTFSTITNKDELLAYFADFYKDKTRWKIATEVVNKPHSFDRLKYMKENKLY